ncbi:MAG: hypothetical protein AAF849_08000 [Bacteroidota bacterium]
MEKQLNYIIQQYDRLKYALLAAQNFDKGHFGFPEIYYKIMESDQKRINAFRTAFDRIDLTHKVVCEAGVGRLALSKHYLPKVKKAYLIESNPKLFDYLRAEIQKHNWQDKVELILGDARNVVLPEPVDAIIGELMSIYAINELQVEIFKHLRQFLKADGHLLPEKIMNVVQLVQTDFEEDHRHYPLLLTRHLPTQLSLQKILNTIDLYQINELGFSGSITITPILSGKVNAIYMHSFVQIIESCNFTGTDSLMPPTLCRLEKEVAVTAGKTVKLYAQFKYGTSLDEAQFWVE